MQKGFQSLSLSFNTEGPTIYKIALGEAHGLAYLNHHCSPAIIHRDVKSTNILLNKFCEAKIASNLQQRKGFNNSFYWYSLSH